jgi:hypothetical protein
VAGLLLALSTTLWAVQVVAVLTPPPPTWGWVVVGSVFALAAPVGTYLVWRGDKRARVPMAHRIRRAEQIAGLLGVATLLVFVVSHLATPY